MRTNIEIDDQLMEAALRAGPFATKKDAVEAGLKLLTRQAAYREILRWEGKLQWDGDDAGSAPSDTTAALATASERGVAPTPAPASAFAAARPMPALSVQEPAATSQPNPALKPKRRHAGG